MNDRTPLRGRNQTFLPGLLHPWAIVAVVVSALALHVVLYGPAIREKADRARAEEIDRENHALCVKLGLANEGERFAACADVLLEARRLQANRLASELAGIL
jgi:hypothetical protein